MVSPGAHPSLETLQAVFDALSDGIVVASVRTKRFVLVNPAACRLLGRDLQDVLRLSVHEIHPPSHLEEVLDYFQRQARGEISLAPGIPVQRPDGHTFYVDISTSLMDVQGEPCLIGVFRDVTERRRLEQMVLQAEILTSLGSLAAGVAHQLNNPLSYMLYHLEEAIEGLCGEEEAPPSRGNLTGGCVHRQRLGDALEGARQMRAILRDLRIYSHRDPEQDVPVQVEEVLESAARIAGQELLFRAHLNTHFEATPTVRAGVNRLAQVFLNILVNSAQAIPVGDPEQNEVCIRTWSEEGEVGISVSDTGCGIDPQHLERVFDPFFTTKPPGIGSGIGLALCRKTVNRLGGRIEVESQLGHGTTVKIFLPACGEPAPTPEIVLEEANPELPRVPGRVLVIDDEPQNVLLLEVLLSRTHEVVTARSGIEARAILERDLDFDVILSDLMMPTISGADLHEYLVTRSPNLAGRMVFMTGGAFTPQAVDFLHRISNLKLYKPLDYSRLARLVDDMVRGHRLLVE